MMPINKNIYERVFLNSGRNNNYGFITEWTVSGDAAARTITLPLVNTRAEGSLSYNCTVDWGDGSALSTITAYDDADRVHTYAANGTYLVKIRGVCEGWSFNNGGDKTKITRVISWGNASAFNGFKYLKGGFYGCSNLTSLGTGSILAAGTGVLTDGFYETFRSCTSLVLAGIPSDLFKLHTAVTSSAFNACFRGCTALTSVPAGLFQYNTLAANSAFSDTFRDCSNFTSIPADSFRYNTAITSSGFYETFRDSKLGSIPTDLFRYNTLVGNDGFSTTFRGCTYLTSIPTDLFRYNTIVGSSGFASCFYGCTGLTSLPTDLFRYNTAASGPAFQNTFTGCTGLTSLPTDIFRYNTLASGGAFQGTFQGCSSLASLPTDLFRYNTLVTAFYSTFQNCSALASLPSDLFRYNTACTTFLYTFLGCSSLATVGADLFRYNTLCTVFTETFENCYKLQQRADMFFAAGEESTRFHDQTVNFASCFKRASFTGTQGTAPALWSCDFGTGTPTKTDCWDGGGNSLTSLDNYASIPVEWI